MTKYNLKFYLTPTLSGNKPKQIIILCHGYGGDGKDIGTLATNWRRFLPDAVFVSPDAPETCAINPQGYQWFDLTSEKEEIILEKSLIADNKLSIFLDQVVDDFKLDANQLRNVEIRIRNPSRGTPRLAEPLTTTGHHHRLRRAGPQGLPAG